MTAVALLLYSFATQFWMLALFAVPYGLGAGGVDAALNNYVALHLKSRHMSWLHCMWGVGASISPYIMSYAISGAGGWSRGYLIVSIIQMVLSAAIFISLPLWKKAEKFSIYGGQPRAEDDKKPKAATVKLVDIVKIRGAVACFLCFFCYCALEQTTMLWASSYMIAHNGMTEEMAAMFGSLFFIGITVGRGLNGFLTFKFSDRALIRAGYVLIAVGVALVALPFSDVLTIIGFIVTGLGCAPVYPGIIHSTPALFGAEKSQAIIGMQMAFAYLGGLASPLFGAIAQATSTVYMPVYIAVFLAIMIAMHELMVWQTKKRA